MRTILGLSTAVVLTTSLALAADSATKPRPVPLTRPEMKELLEDMKARKPRIPLPELTEEDKAKLGERGGGYEGRLRYHYMPGGGEQRGGADGAGGGALGGRGGQGGAGRGGEFSRDPDPNMSLDYAFKTRLFWIVSRTNNCQYCLGHQETKLAVAGMLEDEIAALDGDWNKFPVKEQAAFALARKLTYEPQLINDSDIDGLRKHYTDMQILEMIFSVAGNNQINRWKEGVGVPQSRDLSGFSRRADNPPPADRVLPIKTYVTPTSDEYRTKVTKVAPLDIDRATGKPTKLAVCTRPALESRADVEKALDSARKRTPRLPLADEDKARALLPADWPAGPLPQWVRVLANFPRDGKSRIVGLRTAEQTGDLSPVAKAQVSWIIARQDRAWYAVGEAKRRLRQLGQTDEQIYKLDSSWEEFTPAERSLFTVARKLAATPVVLNDHDVDVALKETGPRQVVQLVSYVTGRAFFDRVTEAAGLQLEQ